VKERPFHCKKTPSSHARETLLDRKKHLGEHIPSLRGAWGGFLVDSKKQPHPQPLSEWRGE